MTYPLAVENASFPSELQPLSPYSGDPVSEGQAHIGKIKYVLKTTFPALDGAVTASPDDLNNPLLATERPAVANGGVQAESVPFYNSATTASTFPITPFARELLASANAASFANAAEIDGYVEKTGDVMTGALEVPRLSMTGNANVSATGFSIFVDALDRPVIQFSTGNAIVFSANAINFVMSGNTVASISTTGISTTGDVIKAGA